MSPQAKRQEEAERRAQEKADREAKQKRKKREKQSQKQSRHERQSSECHSQSGRREIWIMPGKEGEREREKEEVGEGRMVEGVEGCAGEESEVSSKQLPTAEVSAVLVFSSLVVATCEAGST